MTNAVNEYIILYASEFWIKNIIYTWKAKGREFRWHNQKEDGLRLELGLRRSTWKLEKPSFVECSHCHEPVEPHRVCPNCGYYDGKEVIAKKEKAAK